MSDALPPSGPPVRLFTNSERLRRRRAVALLVVIIGSFAIFLTLLALRLATQPNSNVNLGSDTFKVGNARALNKLIRADDYPLLFQDLRNKSIDIWVDHEKGKPSWEGWRAIQAHAPGQPRRCQLEWTGEEYRDPCSDATYPADGEGLRSFDARVVNGTLLVDFTKGSEN